MAKNKSTVYLGYDDEEITKYAGHSTLNKIGGTPDWPPSCDIKIPSCPLCGMTRPLIVQIYAPLEQSQFHRTLYIFACLNPVCSQNSKSWLCVRTQHLDIPYQVAATDLISAVPPPAGVNKKKGKNNKQQQQQIVAKIEKITWCNSVDDWGDGSAIDFTEDMDTTADDFKNLNEENGNVIEKHDNSPIAGSSLIGSEGEEDDEDESTSMDNDLICGFGQLDMNSPQNNGGEDPNANCAGGAVGVVATVAAAGDGNIFGGVGATATICAEIEGAETDVVLVESPQKPERDLIALLKQKSSPAVLSTLSKLTDLTLKPYFIVVDIEQRQRNAAAASGEFDYYGSDLSADHIRDLYQEYKRQDETAQSPSGGAVGGVVVVGAAAAEEQEIYENSLPAHGDLIMHKFISTLQQNPGQVLRYSRDTLPILIAPLKEPIPKCPNCNSDTICELQILSTLIPKLHFQQNNELTPIEYGNVLVFTCIKNCWDTPDKMRYERIIVQVEM